jgi:arginine repressor
MNTGYIIGSYELLSDIISIPEYQSVVSRILTEYKLIKVEDLPDNRRVKLTFESDKFVEDGKEHVLFCYKTIKNSGVDIDFRIEPFVDKKPLAYYGDLM